MPSDGSAGASSAPRPSKPRLVLERARFLSEASRLLAQSLEYEATLETVAKLAIPELGAWAIVDIVEEDGEVRRLAVVHPDPSKQALARELERRYPPSVEDALGAPAVLRTREAELVPAVTDELLVDAARDARHLEILRALGMGSFMVVPMIARGEVVGCMTFISAESGRRYVEDDLVIAEDLATRCALAVDNARLYRQARRARREALAAAVDAERRRGAAETAWADVSQARDEAVELGLQAEESERAKADFVSTMSHELRTPINAVLGYADLLLTGVAGGLTDEQRRYLERQQAASRHLLALVNDVLDIAKADANRLLVTRELADAREAVRGAFTMVQPQALDRQVTLSLDESATPEPNAAREAGRVGPYAYLGDPRRTEQVLINLLMNAVKFTPTGGRVEVAFERRVGAVAAAGAASDGRAPEGSREAAALPTWLLIHVRDTGIGIPAEAHERVFQPFIQLDPGRTRGAGGSGLGLAISRRIARLMDGDLTLESHPGDGSTFTLWLRAAPVEGLRKTDGATDLSRRAPHVPHAPHAGGERRGPERLVRGLYEVGDALLRAVDEVTLRYSERVRVDPAIPAAREAPWTELANHTATLLTDVAQALGVIEEAAGGGALLMRLGEEIRAVISERHGQRRAQLGWTLEGLERDSDILEEEVATGVRRALPDDPTFPAAEGLEIMGKLLARSRELARAGFLREHPRAATRAVHR